MRLNQALGWKWEAIEEGVFFMRCQVLCDLGPHGEPGPGPSGRSQQDHHRPSELASPPPLFPHGGQGGIFVERESPASHSFA